MYCFICTSKLRINDKQKICSECLGKIEKNKDLRHICTGYHYVDNVRFLILQAKLHSNPIALKAISKLTLELVRFHFLVYWADKIIPAPSSIQSRFNGSTDIARYLLGKCPKEKHHFLPWKNYMRWKKQARKKTRNDQIELLETRLKSRFNQKGPKFLIIDDVLTSGATILRILDHLPAGQVEVFVLASPRHF